MRTRYVHFVPPREHGAWAILLLPYVSGAVIGSCTSLGGVTGLRVLVGAAAVLLLVVSRPPLMTLIKRRHKNGAFGEESAPLIWGFIVPAAISTAIFLLLILTNDLWCLLVPGALGLLLFCLHLGLILGRHERAALAELTGISMLALTAPAAWCIATGFIDIDAWVLYLLNVLYFGASVFYVKTRLRASRGVAATVCQRLARSHSVIYYLAVMFSLVSLAAASGLAPALVPIAYLPMVAYQLWNVLSRHAVKRIMVEGLMQTALASVFSALIILFYLA